MSIKWITQNSESEVGEIPGVTRMEFINAPILEAFASLASSGFDAAKMTFVSHEAMYQSLHSSRFSYICTRQSSWANGSATSPVGRHTGTDLRFGVLATSAGAWTFMKSSSALRKTSAMLVSRISAYLRMRPKRTSGICT